MGGLRAQQQMMYDFVVSQAEKLTGVQMMLEDFVGITKVHSVDIDFLRSKVS